ncbi:MAG: hypothetical protein EXR82_00270 [Gammaproteobacteria bacterium]|nr:hypothetical protein [Gammaproteobacteria bacterium]
MKYRWSRIAGIVISFVLPLTNLISAAIVVITARRNGGQTAALDVAVSVALLTGLVALSGSGAAGAGALTASLGAALWGGALLSGILLGRYQSVDLAVQALVVLALLGVLVGGVAIPDARAHWQPVLEALIQAAGLPQVSGLPAGWLGTVATLMHGIIGASLLSTLVLAVMLGLWLDRDHNGGEWRRQFLELRLGLVLSLAAGVATVLTFAGFVSVGGGALLVLGTGFATQGLAIVHWTADQRRWPRIWPLVLYGPLLLGAPPAGLVLLVLAIAGLVDNAFTLRRRPANVV